MMTEYICRQGSMVSVKVEDSTEKDKICKATRLPNFLIETILKQIPNNARSVAVSTNSTPCEFASCIADREVTKYYPNTKNNEQDLMNYAHQVSQWRWWLQSIYGKSLLHNDQSQMKNVLPTQGEHLTQLKSEPRLWNPVFDDFKPKSEDSLSHDLSLESPQREYFSISSESQAAEDTTKKHLNARPASKNLSPSAPPAKLPNNPINLEKDMEENKQAIWPAWVYCTRYSDRPSAGPRKRKARKKNMNSKEDMDKRARTAFTTEQLKQLQEAFNESQYLTEERRVRLSEILGLTVAQIKVWFQNQRAKVKKASGVRSVLEMQLVAQGLYNHCTQSPTSSEKGQEV